MKTKLISLLLSCVLLLSLAACAKEGPGSDETTKETTAQTTEENTTQTDTTVEETTESQITDSIETGWNGPEKNPNMEYCHHGIACEFDDKTMTLTNAYKGNTVESIIEAVEKFLADDNRSVHHAKVLYNGEEVTEGELQVGMLIQVYHDDELYGTYTIEEIKIPA